MADTVKRFKDNTTIRHSSILPLHVKLNIYGVTSLKVSPNCLRSLLHQQHCHFPQLSVVEFWTKMEQTYGCYNV